MGRLAPELPHQTLLGHSLEARARRPGCPADFTRIIFSTGITPSQAPDASEYQK